MTVHYIDRYQLTLNTYHDGIGFTEENLSYISEILMAISRINKQY